MATEEKKTVSWEEYTELKKHDEQMKQENERLKAEVLKAKKASNTGTDHSGEFWTKVHRNMVKDPEYVKRLVRSKILGMNDRRPRSGMTLLMLAAGLGSQEIVQFCLNQGADITLTDNNEQTALEIAGMYGYYHCEQLLLFATMNLGIGNEIRTISATIYQQNGINRNMFHELDAIGEQSTKLFEGLLMELMINMIQKRLSFDDTLLSFCWQIASKNGADPCDSELWKAIASTLSSVIAADSTRDWHWIKRYIVPSMIWYKSDVKTKQFLYFKLLDLVDVVAMRQLSELEKDLNVAADINREEWNKLCCYSLPDQYERVRQDLVPNGIQPTFSFDELLTSSGATFNSPVFYDHNQYLSQLNLLAQIVDDEFQASVQEMFIVDKVKGTCSLYDVLKDTDIHIIGDGALLYQRGPLKRIERARNKTQNDYPDEDYPTSACVVDFNRCSLVFNDISTLLGALQLFVAKVEHFQSGSIIGIARCKNGFMEYVEQTGYADVKLNVIIRGTHNNIIGEVQFLLSRMKAFKQKAHRLYTIQRQKENIEQYVSKTLPLLLNEDKHLYIAGNRGSVAELCEIMVTLNYSEFDLMKQDIASGRTIIHAVCILGHVKAFHFFKKVLPIKEFVQACCHTLNVQGISPASYAIWKSHVPIIQVLFSITEIRDTFRDNRDSYYRLLMDLFCFNTNDDVLKYVMKLMNITQKDVQEMMSYEYKSRFDNTASSKNTAAVIDKDVYGEAPILIRLIRQSTNKELKNLVEIIGEKTFLDACQMIDSVNENALEKVIQVNKIQMMQFILETDVIKNKWINDENLLKRLIKKMNDEFHDSMVKCVIEKLQLTVNKLNDLKKKDNDLNISKLLEIAKKQ